jgi:hypothetical protein
MSTTISSVNEMDMRAARISLERALAKGRNTVSVQSVHLKQSPQNH